MQNLTRRALVAAAAVTLTAATLSSAPAIAGGPLDEPTWQASETPFTESLRGLDALDRDTAWVAGDDGGVFRTVDGGDTWIDASPEGADDLLFRDVEAMDAVTATVLAIGFGDASRVLRTEDGGATWETTFVSDEPTAFFNCMDFFPGGQRGLAVSDPVDGKFRIIATDDGGRTWSVVPSDGMPAAHDGEYNFSASGTCLVTAGGRDAWFATGGAAARIFHSEDGGMTWSVTDTPIPASPAGGVFSLAFRNPQQGVAVGGDFLAPTVGEDASAVTEHGESWMPGGDLEGYRSAVAWVQGAPHTVIAVGPSGSSLSTDEGRTWTSFSDVGFHAVDCTRDGACWASGSGGRVATLAR